MRSAEMQSHDRVGPAHKGPVGHGGKGTLRSELYAKLGFSP